MIPEGGRIGTERWTEFPSVIAIVGGCGAGLLGIPFPMLPLVSSPKQTTVPESMTQADPPLTAGPAIVGVAELMKGHGPTAVGVNAPAVLLQERREPQQ